MTLTTALLLTLLQIVAVGVAVWVAIKLYYCISE
jgi:hypothetical protein